MSARNTRISYGYMKSVACEGNGQLQPGRIVPGG